MICKKYYLVFDNSNTVNIKDNIYYTEINFSIKEILTNKKTIKVAECTQVEYFTKEDNNIRALSFSERQGLHYKGNHCFTIKEYKGSNRKTQNIFDTAFHIMNQQTYKDWILEETVIKLKNAS